MSLRAVANNAGGVPGSSLNIASDGGAVSGAGPYTLSHAPAGGLLQVFLDGVKQLPANYSVTGTALTFVGLTMANYAQWSATYGY